jgi:predicted amidohydrolase YtcJ
MYDPLKYGDGARFLAVLTYANRILTSWPIRLLAPISGLKDVAQTNCASNFQLNTHAIGDSANTVILKIYEVLTEPKIEDGKLSTLKFCVNDFDYFKFGIIPSVQPSLMLHPMYWAEDRLGKVKKPMLIKNYPKKQEW